MKTENCDQSLANIWQSEEEGIQEALQKYHNHAVDSKQCSSFLSQRIQAPLSIVWSIIRRFDMPQLYKCFIKSCVMNGEIKVGSTREVTVISGLPANTSTERLELLDEENHVISFRVVGGEHRLQNYHSITSLHEQEKDGKINTVVIESYVVDVPPGNSNEETITFTDTVVRLNLQSLAKLAEQMAVQKDDENFSNATASLHLSD